MTDNKSSPFYFFPRLIVFRTTTLTLKSVEVNVGLRTGKERFYRREDEGRNVGLGFVKCVCLYTVLNYFPYSYLESLSFEYDSSTETEYIYTFWSQNMSCKKETGSSRGKHFTLTVHERVRLTSLVYSTSFTSTNRL